MANVSELILTAFQLASRNNAAMHDKWVKISHVIGAILPASMISSSVQDVANLDVLLRSMEEETAVKMKQSKQGDFTYHYQSIISDLFVGSLYEIMRTVKQRTKPAKFHITSLEYDLKLVRVILEKHEIPDDRHLDEPLKIIRQPPSGEERDLYTYDKTDPKRAHIMRTGISDRGSKMWEVINHESKQQWVDRRMFSDRMIEIWLA